MHKARTSGIPVLGMTQKSDTADRTLSYRDAVAPTWNACRTTQHPSQSVQDILVTVETLRSDRLLNKLCELLIKQHGLTPLRTAVCTTTHGCAYQQAAKL